MKLDRSALLSASEELLAGLDRLSHAAGGHSACVWSSRRGVQAYVGNETFSRDGVGNVGRPGDPPYTDEILSISKLGEGFNTLSEPSTRTRLERLPFYRDVLVRCGFSFCAGLNLSPGDGSLLKVGIWRNASEGEFNEDHIREVNHIACNIRFATLFARRTGELLMRQSAAPFIERGAPTFALGDRGQASVLNAAADEVSGGSPLKLSRGRLVAEHNDETRRLDKVIGQATSVEGRPGSVTLTSMMGDRFQVLVIPLHRRALDVFCPTKAIATLVHIGAYGAEGLLGYAKPLLETGFGLTNREADIAVLVAQGLSAPIIARRLLIGEGTVRNHIKAVFRKVGLHTQAELSALVAHYH